VIDIFAYAMKQIAFLFLFIFALVQAGPTVCYLITDATSVFIVDEEKGAEKIDTGEKKEKKDYAGFSQQATDFSHKINTAFLLAETIQLSPSLEKLSPPPNFC
jgi:hypothetical protein